MLNIEEILKNLDELENKFYGTEEEMFEDGVMGYDYDCAEWARSNVDNLFLMIRTLAHVISNADDDKEV